MKSQASEALNPESLQSQNRLRQKIESPIKPLGVLHGRLHTPILNLTAPRTKLRSVDCCGYSRRKASAGALRCKFCSTCHRLLQRSAWSFDLTHWLLVLAAGMVFVFIG
jgi:hypothetical protein